MALDEGCVDITLGAETYTLRPTLAAQNNISRRLGGLTEAHKLVIGQNIEAMATIIQFGLGWEPDDKRVKKLPGMIYAAGAVKLILHLTEYLASLMNGGRRPSREEDQADEGNGVAADAA